MSTWNLSSPDKTLSLSLNVSDDGPLNGTLNYQGASYPVSGGWVAQGSIPGRNFSAFALYGGTQVDAPNLISATGIMIGPGNNPSQVQIQVDVSSSPTGQFSHYSGTLLPG